MNLSYSLPKRNNQKNIQILVSLAVMAFLALAIMQAGVISHGISKGLISFQGNSNAAPDAGPHAVPVPSPKSQSYWQHVVPQIISTPSPAVSQPTAQPVATPLAGK